MEQLSRKKVLILGHQWPEPQTTAAGERMLQLIECLQGAGAQIDFASTALHTKYSAPLKKLGVAEHQIRLNDSGFDLFIRQLDPGIVIFDRFMTEEQFGWRVAANVPDALRVLNTEDLHSLRKARQKAVENNEEFSIEKWTRSDLALREFGAILRSDLNLIISSIECLFLLQLLSLTSDNILNIPFILKNINNSISNSWRSFIDRRHFIFAGNGKHPPNRDGLDYLKQDIWPLIRRELPGSELHVYGAYWKGSLISGTKEGIYFKGWAPDLSAELAKYRLNLVPLRYGAGLKGKIVTAIRSGTPSVCTSIGAEGIFGSPLSAGFISDRASSFAEKAIHLFKNKGDWERVRDYGIEQCNSLFDLERNSKEFINRLNIVSKNLESLRSENLIGAIMRHHSHASTKYLSRWIEEKHKEPYL